jgi:hypothetical protein
MKLLKMSTGYSSKEHPIFVILISPSIPATWNMQLYIQPSI